jgi:hypothetical protein
MSIMEDSGDMATRDVLINGSGHFPNDPKAPNLVLNADSDRLSNVNAVSSLPRIRPFHAN